MQPCKTGDQPYTEASPNGKCSLERVKNCFRFQLSSEIERVASGNMYKEQAWVEKLLKRMRNEADVQSQVWPYIGRITLHATYGQYYEQFTI